MIFCSLFYDIDYETSSSHFLQNAMNVAQVKNARVRMRTKVRRNLRPEFRCLKNGHFAFGGLWWIRGELRDIFLSFFYSLGPPIVGLGGELFLFCSLLADSNLLLRTPWTLLEEKYQYPYCEISRDTWKLPH